MRKKSKQTNIASGAASIQSTRNRRNKKSPHGDFLLTGLIFYATMQISSTIITKEECSAERASNARCRVRDSSHQITRGRRTQRVRVAHGHEPLERLQLSGRAHADDRGSRPDRAGLRQGPQLVLQRVSAKGRSGDDGIARHPRASARARIFQGGCFGLAWHSNPPRVHRGAGLFISRRSFYT